MGMCSYKHIYTYIHTYIVHADIHTYYVHTCIYFKYTYCIHMYVVYIQCVPPNRVAIFVDIKNLIGFCCPKKSNNRRENL